ncbi:MAG: M48 family metalloprotease [Treponema sp.]|jgi:predicted Zn-dependent protease|nr:M48 family metalloprotease [Treponema sp.]
MKQSRIFGFILAALVALTTCESIDSDVWGGLAAAGASALGIDDNVANAIGAGVGTLAESSKAARELTPENEYYIGRAVAANITTQYKVYNGNPALQLYLNKICNAIAINSPRPEIWNGYHVAILDTQEINGFATPGGHIFLTRGLIACTSTEDELASVIAHEIAHIQLQHGLTSIRNSRYIKAVTSGALAGFGAAAGGDLAELADIMDESVGEVVSTIISKGYSKEQEYEADATALSLLASAGYEPSAILGMLHALEKNEQSGSGFGKTHPDPGDRIAGVNKKLASYKVPDTQEFRRRRYTAVKK